MASALETFDFEKLFDEVIVPALAPQEAERKRLWARFKQGMMLAIPGAGAVGAAAAFAAKDVDTFWIIGGIILGVAAFWLYLPLQKLSDRCKVEVLERLAEALGMRYQLSPANPPGFQPVCTYRLVPSYDRSSFEDMFSGEHRGLSFDIYEAKLESKNENKKDSYTTVFAGQIMRIAFPKKFLGVTVVNRDFRRRWKRDGFERVGLESLEFERAFEVFGADQVEARYLVHPAFMARLLDLEAGMGGKELRCVFVDGDLIIVVAGHNMFEVVSASRPIPDRELTRKGVEQIRGLFAVMDQVLDPPRPQWGAKA
jgi:hypothetical protein